MPDDKDNLLTITGEREVRYVHYSGALLATFAEEGNKDYNQWCAEQFVESVEPFTWLMADKVWHRLDKKDGAWSPLPEMHAEIEWYEWDGDEDDPGYCRGRGFAECTADGSVTFFDIDDRAYVEVDMVLLWRDHKRPKPDGLDDAIRKRVKDLQSAEPSAAVTDGVHGKKPTADDPDPYNPIDQVSG